MTATVLASVHWQRLDGPGEDSCRLVQEPQGYLLSGHARYVAAGQEIALDYLVRCDLNWRSTSADVAGLIDGGEVAWRITRDSQGWLLNGARQGLADCTDIDLAITPATNLLPLRRMDPEAQELLWLSAAWFRPDAGGRLTRLDQSYTRLSPQRVDYASAGFQARLEVHPSGFVTRYEGLWQGRVDAQA